MAFQAPFEIAQSRLARLRISSVDSREVLGAIVPFFDDSGAIRILAIDTSGPAVPGEAPGGVFLVEDFPLEIRLGKAIYPRAIAKYRPLVAVDPREIAGLHHHDLLRTLPSRPDVAAALGPALDHSNVALRSRGREKILDLLFTLDLRRLTGSVSRSGLLGRRRMELAALRAFLHDTEPAEA